ncbi:MAG TPA: hypothetical protein VE546_01685 [Streptomyces sp.]|uniref:hypothetical protein n=1 Tax=Streptomyces sp. TaxID=1931 RepID=UPI002D721B10|nr:hypothetical protein [Streptomyces sp.]HZG02283.1 hypothetical protein [Streptomyces sp.]
MNHEATRLAEAMRHEAGALSVGPPPVDAVLREGRRMRRRRRRTAAGAAATAVLATLACAVLLPPRLSPGPDPAPPAAASPRPAPSATAGEHHAPSSAVRVVRPYEPVGIGQGALLGLLPEGEQNYVVAWDGPEDFREQIEHARHLTGDNIRPDSIACNYSSSERGTLYTGTFRTDTEPARITVEAAGRTWEAEMVRLAGDPGWGAYHVDAGRTGIGDGSITVTAYGPDGTVLARLRTTVP